MTWMPTGITDYKPIDLDQSTRKRITDELKAHELTMYKSKTYKLKAGEVKNADEIKRVESEFCDGV